MARCMFPYMVERELYHNQKDKYVPVPCGKCPQCLKRRTAGWLFRLEVEALRWQKQFFVTLTYDTEYVPITENGFLTLQPADLTNFFKRLRKRAGKCRYYLCGEYGTQKKRPHYHMILFGESSMEETDIMLAWTDVNKQCYDEKTKKYYHPPLGNVFFGSVEDKSITYTVQYYDKGVWTPEHKRDDRHPEFSRMSQGIGQNFLSPAQVNSFLSNPAKAYIYDSQGRKIAIPRYYKKRLYDYFTNDIGVANNPSILVHRDKMLEAKELHHKAVSKIMEEQEKINPTPEDSKELQESRQWAIINYRNSKRKTRK